MKNTRRFLCWVPLLAGLVAAAHANTAWARQAAVTTTDGRTFEGEVADENESFITLVVSGIRVPISRDDVAHIQYRQTIEQQYNQRRAQMSDDDLDRRYKLAYWLYENGAWALARQELDDLAQRFPDDTRVARLGGMVVDRVESPPRSPAVQGQPMTRPTDVQPSGQANADRVGPSGPRQREGITQRRINLIKVYEIDLDGRPGVVVPPEVTEKVFTQYGDHPAVPRDRRHRALFRSAPGYKQLELLFQLRARELYGLVRVKGDPPALHEFRTKIHQRYVLNYCGTVACHGGSGAGGFTLIREDPSSEQTVYGNFFVLQTTTVGPEDMINRQRSGRSVLLQYGLAGSHAVTPHPEVPGWRPAFQDSGDELFQTIDQWIDSLWKPAPDYGVGREP